jgi:hypothetical protein
MSTLSNVSAAAFALSLDERFFGASVRIHELSEPASIDSDAPIQISDVTNQILDLYFPNFSTAGHGGHGPVSPKWKAPPALTRDDAKSD